MTKETKALISKCNNLPHNFGEQVKPKIIELGLWKNERMLINAIGDMVTLELSESGIVGEINIDNYKTTWYDCPKALQNKFNQFFRELATGKVEII